jgi:hypothetical protein
MSTAVEEKQLSAKPYAVWFGGGFVVASLSMMGFVELFPERVFNVEYPMWQRQHDVALGSDKQARAQQLLLGDSRAMAGFIPEQLGPEFRSLALGGGGPIETYFLFRKYLQHNPRPSTIVVSFSPFLLSGMTNFWRRGAKFKLISADEQAEVFQDAVTLSDPILDHTSMMMLRLRSVVYRVNFPYLYWPEFRNALDDRAGENQLKYQEVTKSRGHSLFGTKNGVSDLNEEAGLSSYTPSPLLILYLRKLLALAVNDKTKVLLVTMPINESSFRALSPELKTKYRAVIAKIAAEFPSIEAHSEIEAYPDELFGDPSHLNARGAAEFSRRFREVLDAKGQAALP